MRRCEKKDGSRGALELIPVMLTIMMCGILLLFFARQIQFLNVSNEVENLAHRAILKMESQRGLTVEEMRQIEERLKDLGVREISFAGTSFWNPELRPGDDICFCLSGKYVEQKQAFYGVIDLELPGVERPFQVTRCSVVMK